jgi:hypothetical protein
MTTTLIRRAGALTLVAATTAALTGCAGVLGAKMTYNDTVQKKITEIRIDGDSGDVNIKTAAVDETTITRLVRHSSNPEASYRLDGTVLTIDTDCGHNCSVSYEIKAPAGVAVSGELHSGDVALDGVGATDLQVTSGNVTAHNTVGAVKLRATSGDVDVFDSKAAVTAQVTSGNVRAMNAAGPVDIKATSGDVQVKMAVVQPVRAHASSGNVDVIVPPGSYKIVTDTGSGDESVAGLTNDPSSSTLIDARAGSGDVSVTAAAA